MSCAIPPGHGYREERVIAGCTYSKIARDHAKYVRTRTWLEKISENSVTFT